MDYPLINITHVEALHLATREEMNYVIETARKINQILSDFTSEIGVELVVLSWSSGATTVNCSLQDEISPDSARFWDARTHEPMDLDRFRRDLGGVEQAYQDLLHRMMGE